MREEKKINFSVFDIFTSIGEEDRHNIHRVCVVPFNIVGAIK